MNTLPSYQPSQIEPKWQQQWFSENSPFRAEVDPSKPKYYVLEMLPYPSGQLHMGHVRNYTMGDVLARFKRATGYNVMHPMGWDAFGLPAENAAIKRKTHPKQWTLSNIAEMKSVMKQFGWSYDWTKEVTTCLPDYYGQQQALFLSLAEKGLVYRKESLVNWDPVDNTVLANEQVVDGKGWRSGAPVERRLMPQWMMKITHYADQLLTDLSLLEGGWPDRVRTMQENWLGRSEGVEFFFQVKGPGLTVDEKLHVYTTRPDTMYGVSFCVLAAEHPLARKFAETDAGARQFALEAESMGTSQEVVDKAEKKGYPTPYTALNPITGQEVPILIANYVLATVGTGAVMGVPGHDGRDHEFAKKYNLPIVYVERNRLTGELTGMNAYGEDDILENSAEFNGMSAPEAKRKITERLEQMGIGKHTTNWRLRDWGISRQRYWGCPIPFIHCEKCGVVPVPREALPVELPEDVDITGSGNPLENHPTWKHVNCPKCQGKAVRETDTMDTFADSSWYFMRYLCPKAAEPLEPKAMQYWMGTEGVDQYIGGIEHAVLHLLYARFFCKALRDCGYTVPTEPFKALLCQGMVIGNTYQKADGSYLYPSQIELKEGKAFEKATGEEVKIFPAEKISKSKNNGDSPEGLVAKYGADTLRLYMLFTSPPERDLEWSEAAIEGAWRFLNRVWGLATKSHQLGTASGPENRALNRKIHQTIRKVSEDINRFAYNTMIAACMELSNELAKLEAEANPALLRFGVEALLRLLNPAVPHITEELWAMLGHQQPLTAKAWPTWDEAAAKADEITLIVQVDGKLRARLTLPADVTEQAALEAAHAAEDTKPWLTGRKVVKQVYVPGKLVNIATTA